MTEMSKAETRARELLANNGRNTANGNEGIRVGSHLHLCEMLLADIDTLRGKLIAANSVDAKPEFGMPGNDGAGTDYEGIRTNRKAPR